MARASPEAHANAHGLTGLLDASVEERHARVYRRLAEAEALTARILATARVDPSETAEGAVARIGKLRRECQSPMFRIHSAGSSSTACWKTAPRR